MSNKILVSYLDDNVLSFYRKTRDQLCKVINCSGGGGLTSVTTANSASVTFTGNGTVGSPLTATATGTSTPAGLNTQVQYNNAGSFGADAGFTYISAAQAVILANGLLSSTNTPNGIQFSGSTQNASYTRGSANLTDSGSNYNTNLVAGAISISSTSDDSTITLNSQSTDPKLVLQNSVVGSSEVHWDHISFIQNANIGNILTPTLTANRGWSLPNTSGEFVVNNNFLSNLKAFVNWGQTTLAVSPANSVYTIPHNSGWLPQPSSFAITFSDSTDNNVFSSKRSIDANNITITCVNPPVSTSTVTIFWQTFR